jgi:hypothetical protein
VDAEEALGRNPRFPRKAESNVDVSDPVDLDSAIHMPVPANVNIRTNQPDLPGRARYVVILHHPPDLLELVEGGLLLVVMADPEIVVARNIEYISEPVGQRSPLSRSVDRNTI